MTGSIIEILPSTHLGSAPKTPQLFRAERDRVGHSSIWSSPMPNPVSALRQPFWRLRGGQHTVISL